VNRQQTSGGFGELVKNSGFQAFLWTQFLGAFNDNLYKTVVSLRAVDLAAKTGTDYLFLSGGVFVLPFLLFSGYSGHFADRLSKRSILIAVKIFEIFVMAFGLAVFFTDRLEWMLVVLFLMALHSTIFSPAKYGIIPEMLPDKLLSRANALLEMTTFMAIVLGTSISSFLFDIWAPWKIGAAMTAIAVIGFLSSLGIPRTPAAAAPEPFRWNPFADVILGTKSLLRDRPMWLAVIGISFFWALGALFQLNLLLYGSEVLHVDHQHLAWMVTALAVGIGVGNLLAGKLSGDRVELGLVPIGGFLIGLASLALAASGASYGWSVAVLAILGVVSGPYIVPLNTFLQHRAASAETGRIMATNSFYNTVGLMIAFGLSGYVHDHLGLSTEKLFLGAGIVTLGGTLYLVWLLPDHLLRLLFRGMLHVFYRIRVQGRDRVPQTGPALLISNHVSFMDGILIAAQTERRIRFMIWKPYYEHWALNRFCRLMRLIPLGTTGPRDMVTALATAREQLEQGHVVCIFGEGAITRTGSIQPFKRGFERIVKGTNVPVIPVHLDRVWGSIFSYAGGKFFAKLPRIPHPATVSFGAPLPSSATPTDVHQAIIELSAEAADLRLLDGDTLPQRLVRASRRHWNKFAMADSSGRELTHGRALTAALLLSDWVRRNSKGEEMIGLLLPSSAGAALANMGVTLAGRIPVNLNFTAGKDAMASAAAQCSIRTVLTSKIFLAKAKLEAPTGAVYLEDILGRASGASKAWALFRAKLAPARWLYPETSPDSLATVLFSSGSTSTPKGVMLSHHNVIANIEAMLQVFHLNQKDRIVGVLPFFHSFGFTVTLWLPALAGAGAIYHANPIDAKTIGELIAKHRGTFLLSTPTFATTYARKCTREQFASLRVVLVGAEKLRESVAQDFEQTFGLKMLEGYGCTEMAPVVAVNSPDWESGRDSQFGTRLSSVGRPLPGVAAKIVDPETFEPLPRGTAGLLLVKGPNRMQGYLGQPEKTAEALRDGWYNTGDIAVIDDDGFLRITDRLARFSKIGGEMIQHLAVEEAVREATGGEPCCVTGIPDDRKGERIAVLYIAPDVTPQEVWQRLAATDLPKLWLPKREDIHQVESLPTLGTGKLDLRGVRARAVELAEVARA
jgi:acyl-[acyl-carrier-protein]-phospholipid O-acyltransferase/long-chain-fatty-acid--[acyl-carrier-protein] ligase